MIDIADNRLPVDGSMLPDVGQLAQHFIDAFPVMSIAEQRLALKLYRLLSEGDAVSLEHLSERVDMLLTEVETMLKSWPGVFYDNNHRITGFWGLTIDETQHRFEINGKTVYTWCAWDTLFIPELLNISAHITSNCALSGDEISLTVSPEGIESSQTHRVMVSFLVPDEVELKENITTSFCHHVFFLRTPETGKRWVASHPGTFLLSLDEAFSIGKKMNSARYDLVQLNRIFFSAP